MAPDHSAPCRLCAAGALGLAELERALFVAAARGYGPAADVLAARQRVAPGAAAATRGLPRDIAVFTGRQAELAQLMGTLAAVAASGGVVGICAIDGMAGVGKPTSEVRDTGLQLRSSARPPMTCS